MLASMKNEIQALKQKLAEVESQPKLVIRRRVHTLHYPSCALAVYALRIVSACSSVASPNGARSEDY
jgi:hypothetical protein